MFLLVGVQTYAHHRSQVLGLSTSSSELTFPPVSYGPGYILPDSPLFFLDKTFQSLKIALAFTPEQRAKLHAQIAGERMAELRVLMNRNNQTAVNITLNLLEQELEASSKQLGEASAVGKDVKTLAKTINENIKIQRKILGTLASQADGDLKYRLKAAREVLKEAKIKVEDELPEDELEQEIEEGLEDELEEEVDDADDSTRGLEHAVDVLTKLASQAAERHQERREDALRRVIEMKNDTLLQEKAQLLDSEEKNRAKLHEERKEAAKKAREAAREVKKVTEEIKKTEKRVDTIIKAKETPIFKQTPPRPTNSGSGSASSGSGSSSSGTNNSGSSSGSDSSNSGSSNSGSGSNSGFGRSGGSDDD